MMGMIKRSAGYKAPINVTSQFNNLPKQDIQTESMLQFNKHSKALNILFTKVCLIVNNHLYRPGAVYKK